MVAGSLLFAHAQDAVSLIAARICMGIGLAAIGMAAIVASTRWFPPSLFRDDRRRHPRRQLCRPPRLDPPDGAGLRGDRWRSTYIAATIVTAALAAAAALLIRDAPPHHPHQTAFPRGSAPHGVAWRKSSRARDAVAPAGDRGTAYAVVACILGLWAGPYLFDMHGLDPAARGAVIIWIPVGMMLGIC